MKLIYTCFLISISFCFKHLDKLKIKRAKKNNLDSNEDYSKIILPIDNKSGHDSQENNILNSDEDMAAYKLADFYIKMFTFLD